MSLKLKTRIHQLLYGLLLGAVVLLLCLGATNPPTAHAQAAETPGPGKYYTVITHTLPDGKLIEQAIINGPPKPPPGYETERKAVEPSAANTLTVPAFNWVFGCSAVSGAMIAGYYDRNGWPNFYTGPTNGGVMPLNNSSWGTWTDGSGATYPNLPLAASHNGVDGRVTKGSIDDYWVQYGSAASDPYITGGWGQHTWGDAIGDYMKTSQSFYTNTDGSTQFWNFTSASQLTCAAMPGYGITNDGTQGRKAFYEARGYSVTDCYNQPTDNKYSGGFSFAQYKAEIDAGNPVMLNLAGHTIVGVGYNDTGNTVYIHDTWDYLVHSFTWGGSYAGMGLESVSIVHLQPPSYTISGNAGTGGATITYTGGSVTADGSGNYSFTVNSGWSGTVTPSKTGYTFTPASRTYSNVTSNQTNQNYAATLNTYTISGNAGTGGATITYTGGSVTADGSGNYSFTISHGWSGTVTPSKTGYTFTPPNRTYSNVTSNQTNQNYTAALLTYTISGNAGTGGAIITYTGGSVTADGSGNYSITVSYGWGGIVTPSKIGYTFTPPNRAYANVTANQTNQNYTATLNTYTISGNAGTGGATITYTGGSVTADGSGNYSFTISHGWSGTVTPSKTGYTFSPPSQTYSNVTANQADQDYTATLLTYTISGNAGTGGATITYTGGSVTADGSGNYSFTISHGWSGTVTPSKTGYTFSPPSRTYSNVTANQADQDYTATLLTYTILGNAGTGGATITYTGGSVTADGSGSYSFTISYGWSGTVTPSKTGYAFTPSNRTYSNVTANQTDQNYTATIITYAISGNVAVAGATLTYVDNGTKTVTSADDGTYTITVPYDWSGTVTPSNTGYIFDPTNRSFSNVLNDFTDQNFTVVTWPAWSGGVSLTSDQPVVAVGRPHVGAEVMTYNGFGSGSTTMYVPMLFKNAFTGNYNAALYVQNISDTTSANISISYYDSSGALTCSVTNESLSPQAIKGYWMPSVSCLPVGWVGGAVVTSDEPIVAVGRPHIGSQVTTYAGFASGSPNMYVPMLFKNAFAGGSYNAALYIQNTDPALAATVDIDFYDSDGSLTCSLTGETIAALATKGYWIPSISCLPTGWVGGAVISANRDVVAVGRPHIGAQVTTYNGFSGGQTGLRVPMLFKNAFAGGTYNAALYIQNTDAAQAATVDIDFYDSNGSLTCSLADESIAALATKGYWMPSVACLPVGWVGGAVITANRDVVAVGRPHVGAEVATYGGFGSGSTAMYLPMLFKDAFGGSYDSAVYVQNTSGSNPANVTFKFYDTVGKLSCLKTASIPAGATVGYWLPTLTCTPP